MLVESVNLEKDKDQLHIFKLKRQGWRGGFEMQPWEGNQQIWDLVWDPLGFPSGSVVKNPPAMQETQERCVQSLDREDPLEEGMATHPEGKLHGSKQPGVKTPLQVLPTTLCKTKNSLIRRKKWTLMLIMTSSQLVQPLAHLQNSLPQPFKRQLL